MEVHYKKAKIICGSLGKGHVIQIGGASFIKSISYKESYIVWKKGKLSP